MKKILFIEDESALQKTFDDALEGRDYTIVHALDGESGLRLAKEEKPNLILLDLILPKMNGFDVLSNLKKDSETNSIPVIVLTNLEDMGDIQRALDLGATTYLVKANYRLEEIVKKVEEGLSTQT